MRRFLSILLLGLVTLGLFIGEAEAKRFGGGRSFGVSRSSSSYYKAPAQSSIGNAANQSRASKWLGPLAGLALGGMLASLFMGHGMSNILMWVMLAFGALMIMRLWRSRSQAVTQERFTMSDQQAHRDHYSSFMQTAGSSAAANVPPGFDTQEFLREAKVQFYRLQTAYDQKNLADIREFTTPEVFAEVKLQIQERGDAVNQTDVVSLDANLLEVVNDFEMGRNSVPTASVQFSGTIREEQQDAAEFKEIWHFRKDLLSSKWIVAGVEQH